MEGIRSVALAALLAATTTACGDRDGGGRDAAVADAGGSGGRDAGPDGASADGGAPDGASADGGAPDGAAPDGGGSREDGGAPPPIVCDTVAANLTQLQAAVASARPGTTLCLAAGEWRNLQIAIDADGEEAAPITIAAERPGATVVTGESRVRLGGSHLVLHGLLFRGGRSVGGHLVELRNDRRACTRCRVTEIAILGVDVGAGESKWVSLYGSHNRVDHGWFVGKSNEGALLVVWRPGGAEDHHLVDHNYFGDRPPLGRNGAEAIRVGTSDTHASPSYTVVEHNLFERMNGEIEIVSNKSGRNTYRYNTFRESAGLLTLRHGDDCVVEGNWFLTGGVAGAGGIRVVGARHRVINNYVEGVRTGSENRGGIVLMAADADPAPNGYQHVDDVVVAFNTIVASQQSFVFGGGSASQAPRRPHLANNVVARAVGPVVRTIRGVTDPIFAGNLWHGESLGIGETAGIRFVDPRLERAADGIERPASDSPAIDAAAGALDVREDIDGQPRDATPDVGADERSDAPVRRRPLVADDVGPRSYDPRAL